MGNLKDSLLNENEINARWSSTWFMTPSRPEIYELAKAKGAETIPGMEMFVQQAARQFEIWTGKPAPVAEMQYVVVSELKVRAAAEPKEERPVQVAPPEKKATRVEKKALPAKKAVVKAALAKKKTAKK